MKIAYGIRLKGCTKEVLTDRDGRYELYSYRPKFSNTAQYKCVKVRLIVVKPTPREIKGGGKWKRI